MAEQEKETLDQQPPLEEPAMEQTEAETALPSGARPDTEQVLTVIFVLPVFRPAAPPLEEPAMEQTEAETAAGTPEDEAARQLCITALWISGSKGTPVAAISSTPMPVMISHRPLWISSTPFL